MFLGLEQAKPSIIKVQIFGDSMLPTFRNGDSIPFIFNKNLKFKVGDIVLAKHPYEKYKLIVKRIKHIKEKEKYFLVGDNPNTNQSTDSNSFGYIIGNDILAKSEIDFPSTINR
tara:strand:- start:1199 stop:1540 length:342 start_codon:yes stop_codon:yes gene_type:complete